MIFMLNKLRNTFVRSCPIQRVTFIHRVLRSELTNWKWKWKLLSCVWLCDPMNYTVHGILQARILEWAVFPSSRGSSSPRDWTQVSCIAGGFFTSWATREAQEYWSGEPIPSPGDLPDPGIEPGSPHCRQILYQLSYQESNKLKGQQ